MNKEIDVLFDVDVLVVGCGVAGMIAAIGAAKEGARTLVVDRYGQPGGNMGPGNVIGAPSLELPEKLAAGVPGIAGALIEKCEEMTGHTFLYNYFEDSQTYSYLVLKEFEKHNVECLFNVFSGDPIMDGNTVSGIFVETKSGTKAIKAKVVIDCTGDADVVVRAGAPYDDGNSYVRSGCYYALANVDVDVYKNEVMSKEPSEDEFRWVEEHEQLFSFGGHARFLIPYIRKAFDAGEPFEFSRQVDGGYIAADHGLFWGISGFSVDDPHKLERYGICGGIMGLNNTPDRKFFQDTGDPVTMTRLESATRTYIVEWAKFVKKWVPGFEKSHLHYIGAYYHGRGGRSMVPTYQITREDCENEARFDDTVFEAVHGLKHPDSEDTPYELWDVVMQYHHDLDWPYRQFLPQEVEGLLCAGRASIIQPPVLRMRFQMLMCGEAVGRAAAQAIKQGVSPRDIDLQPLRETLYKEGFPMGPPERVKELGLS